MGWAYVLHAPKTKAQWDSSGLCTCRGGLTQDRASLTPLGICTDDACAVSPWLSATLPHSQPSVEET